MADRLTRVTTALAVIAVATVAAIISYRHELVRSHGESGATARLVPFTVDGLIWAASMVILDANQYGWLSPCRVVKVAASGAGSAQTTQTGG